MQDQEPVSDRQSNDSLTVVITLESLLLGTSGNPFACMGARQEALGAF